MDVCVQRCGVLIHNMFVGSGSKTTSLYATMLCFLKDYSSHVLCQSVDRQYPVPLQHTSKTMTQRDRLHYGISCAVQVDRNQGERDEDEQLKAPVLIPRTMSRTHSIGCLLAREKISLRLSPFITVNSSPDRHEDQQLRMHSLHARDVLSTNWNCPSKDYSRGIRALPKRRQCTVDSALTLYHKTALRSREQLMRSCRDICMPPSSMQLALPLFALPLFALPMPVHEASTAHCPLHAWFEGGANQQHHSFLFLHAWAMQSGQCNSKRL